MEAIRYAANAIRDEFPEKTWAVFCATTMDGRPASEVAVAFGCSVGTVYVYRCRVTARLREKASELADLWEDQE
jgi:RNA polymerase sigma-70 factor (ECF subfamily)